MRCVLGLFEGVVTGAADGYGRMAGKPAVTLLHCGPGLANGLANLHNARRAQTPIVNLVGDLATYHRALDPPLVTDIESWARPVSAWTRTVSEVLRVGADAAAAVAAARSRGGGIATLILPSDVCWNPGGVPAGSAPALPPPAVDEAALEGAARRWAPGSRRRCSWADPPCGRRGPRPGRAHRRGHRGDPDGAPPVRRQDGARPRACVRPAAAATRWTRRWPPWRRSST